MYFQCVPVVKGTEKDRLSRLICTGRPSHQLKTYVANQNDFIWSPPQKIAKAVLKKTGHHLTKNGKSRENGVYKMSL